MLRKQENRVKLYLERTEWNFFILFLLMLKHLQHTSSLRKAVSTSISNHLVWTRHAPGWGGQSRCDTHFASRFATRTALNRWKKGRWNTSHLECYVFLLQFTKVSCMGLLTLGKAYNSVLLPHILIVTCLFRLMTLTIFHSSCSWFKYQKCYHVTLSCITRMWKENNCCVIVPLEQMNIILVVQYVARGASFLLALISPPFFSIYRRWKQSQNLHSISVSQNFTESLMYLRCAVAIIPFAVVDEGNTTALLLLPRLNHLYIS